MKRPSRDQFGMFSSPVSWVSRRGEAPSASIVQML
jgi:hypothetical protein